MESLWGAGGDTSHTGGGVQQEDAACDPGWMGTLLTHKATSLTALSAAAALAFLAFWDFKLMLELVSTPLHFSYLRMLTSAATPCREGYLIAAVLSDFQFAVSRMSSTA